jgi:NADH dehydrogenase
MSKKTTKVVVVGGGFAGVKTALNLANKPGYTVQLMSDNTHFEYHGALYRSAVGHSPMEVVIPLREIFKNAKNVELILDSAGIVDAKKKRIASLTGNIYSYDKAVFALGNTVNYFGIEGLQQHTVTMSNIPSTIKLRKDLVELFKVPQKKPIRIAIIGAGPSGVELAGEIPAFAKLIAKKHNVKQPRVKVILIDGSDRILPNLAPKASQKVAKRLIDLGVEIHLNIRVESCTPGVICMSAGNIGADLIVWTAGSKPVDFYANNPDVFTLGRGGKVVVDDHLLAQGHEDIYVLGDNADTPYSGMAQTALYDADFISRNLLRIQKQQKIVSYRAKKPLYVVTAGPKWAVVQEGNKITSGYRGWIIRRKADLWIFKNFQPYEQAIKTWRHASRMSKL